MSRWRVELACAPEWQWVLVYVLIGWVVPWTDWRGWTTALGVSLTLTFWRLWNRRRVEQWIEDELDRIEHEMQGHVNERLGG